LHRIQNAECLVAAAQQTEPLDLDHYIRLGGFNSPAPVEEVELVADVSPQIAWLLSETPLSNEQSLEPLEDSDWQRLRAKVPNDQETLWWVFGLGENVRVGEPQSWMQAIREKAFRLGALYDQLVRMSNGSTRHPTPLTLPRSYARRTSGNESLTAQPSCAR